MKGLKFISAFALVLGLAACDNYDLPNPPGQTYPQPDGYLTDSDLQIAIAPEAINLVQANEANIEPTVATIEQLDNFPAEYSLSVYMEVASNDAFNPSAVIAATVNGNNISVNPDALNGAIQQAITKKPGTYTINARYIAYATLGSTNLRIGGLDATYGNGTIDVTTLNAAKDIEDAYYLVPCGADGTPDFAKAVEMNNTAGNVSGYDNPEFAIQIDVPETEDYFFMIASASAYEAKDAAALYGCNPAEDNLSGKLSVGSKVGELPLKGSVLITINMEQDSYSVNFAFANIFPISGSTAVNNSMWLYTDNFINYYGVTAINQRWTIYTQADK
ncbi:MAG: hypothetical protein K2H35_05940, partial [Muribaculaceae bacterium]|nr:hypothetical protein [Muribaculaceae bacterium]